MSGSPPRRGDVYWVDFNPARGSEQAGRRPGVVVSLDSFNRAMPVVSIAAITTTDRGSRLCLELPAGRPTERRSFVMPFQIVTIDQSRLLNLVGSLDTSQIVELEQRMRLCWGL